MKAIGIIPARYDSSRLPGKPLADIGGKPMIQHVAERALKSTLLSRVIVATDNQRIMECVQGFGGDAVMTSSAFTSGTDRIASVAQTIETDIVVNIQGDEPLIEPDEIDLVIHTLAEDPNADMGTLVTPIKKVEDLTNPNTAKVVLNQDGYALYFSRSPIPYQRDTQDIGDWLNEGPYFKHVGLYSYRKSFLLQFARHEPEPLEMTEKLEQLRALVMGAKIKVAQTKYNPICVDTPEDLERVRKLIHAYPTEVKGDVVG
ncbi:3-deoxy-manno-octulosonate cytidylyltransferase [candidate division KSB1 bacterium]|nr:3-deoxy-manno-octulosonate cytidylyltransferase [candidate division KSB1 bacterium]